MMESQTPREMLKGLLEGALPPRPLFLPIVFSLGSRVENVPLRAFLTNPTKIFNSLRRMRAHLRSDGIACYFDPYLEAEALGATIDWDSRESGASQAGSLLPWPEPVDKGTLPGNLVSPEQAIRGARIAVAVEVIRRLNTVLRDGSILMAGVTGPFTLATRLTALDSEESLRPEDVSREALDIAASFVTLLATAFVEAGANAIFIQEENLPILSPETCDDWASLLAPTLNIIRFYQALPVLSFSSRTAEGVRLIFQHPWDCLLCPTLNALSASHLEELQDWPSAPRALALPLEIFHVEAANEAGLRGTLSETIRTLRPAILTTAGDVPATTDIKHLSRVLGEIPRAF
jgi:hypothetical protein